MTMIIHTPKSIARPTQLRPPQSAPVQRESHPRTPPCNGNEGVAPAWADGGWHRPFADGNEGVAPAWADGGWHRPFAD